MFNPHLLMFSKSWRIEEMSSVLFAVTDPETTRQREVESRQLGTPARTPGRKALDLRSKDPVDEGSDDA